MTDWRLVLLLVFAFAATSATTIKDFYGRSEAEISAVGPYMKLEVTWKQKRDSCSGRKLLYDLKLEQPGVSTETLIKDFEGFNFTIGESHRVPFWTPKLVLKIREKCFSYLSHSKLDIGDIPGDLLPVKSASFEPQASAAIIKWTPDARQTAAEYAVILVCSKVSRVCLPELREPVRKSEAVVGNVMPGVVYAAQVVLQKEFKNKNYTSKPYTFEVESLPPNAVDYPPVENLTAEVVPQGLMSANLKISFSQPEKIPEGREWAGAVLELDDETGHSIDEPKRTSEGIFLIEELPLLSNFVASVRAVYKHGPEEVLAPEIRTDLIFTGIGAIEKPEITKLMSINETAALVEWSHNPKDDYNYNYTITWGGNDTEEVLSSSGKFYDVIGNLRPGEQLDVFVTASVLHEGHKYENKSEPKKVTMLYEGALGATVAVDSIEPGSLNLKWTVDLPEDPSNCSFEIKVCLKESVEANTPCKHEVRINSKTTAHGVEFFMFRNQTVTVETVCEYHPDVILRKSSDPFVVFGDSGLSPVEKLSGEALDAGSLRVHFEPVAEEAEFVEGYWVGLKAPNVSRSFYTDLTTHTIDNLKPATTYEVSVAPITSKANGAKEGDYRSISLTTKLPPPGKVTKLNVTQEPYSYDVHLSWEGPEYEFGALAYQVDITCGSWKATRREVFDLLIIEMIVEVQAQHKDKCRVDVKAVTDVPNQPEESGETEYAEFDFEGLEDPVSVEISCSEKNRYVCEITPPASAKSLELQYEVVKKLGFSQKVKSVRSLSNRVEFMEPARFTDISLVVKICYGQVCSREVVKNFTTNVGGAGLIEHMDMSSSQFTNILLKWEKPSRTLGPIDGYELTFEDLETHNVVSAIVNGSETSYEFHSEKEHAEYSISYDAFNNNRCGPGRIRGVIGRKRFLTSGKHAPPPKKVTIGKLSSSSTGLYWNVPEDTDYEIANYRVVATPLTEFGVVDKNKADLVFEKIISEPRLEFKTLEPYTNYSIEISSCNGQEDKDCGRGFVTRCETEPGHPSEPSKILPVEEGQTWITLRWLRPKDPQGPIDGYNVAFIKRSAGRPPTNYTTVGASSQFIKLEGLEGGTEYLVHVEAFNKAFDGSTLASGVAELTISTLGRPKGASASTALLIVLVVSVSAAVIASVAYVKYRRADRRGDTEQLVSSMEPADFTATLNAHNYNKDDTTTTSASLEN